MIIDAHCHVWPDHIAPQVLATNPTGLSPLADGTLDGLRRAMDLAGIDRACCLGIATIAKNVERTNEFIGSVDRSRFIPFGTVHQELSVEQNLRSLSDNGIAGVKLHPIFQSLSLADPRVREICVALAQADMVVITHAGAGGDLDATRRGSPAAVLDLANAVPDLKLIACHFGGYHLLDEAEDCLVGTRVVLETSWPPRVAELDQQRIRRLIERHGAERVVYGSDWPMADPVVELASLERMGLNSNHQASVIGGTLAGLLGFENGEGTSK